LASEFWLSEAQWGAIGPLLPKNQPGARRTDDRRVISGIGHVLKIGCRWQDCPAVYGPSTTVYNRFRRWTMRGIWRRLFDALVRADPGDGQAIDSTTAVAESGGNVWPAPSASGFLAWLDLSAQTYPAFRRAVGQDGEPRVLVLIKGPALNAILRQGFQNTG
jgi:transposase